ncbi:MAG: hypothetical protein QOD75_118 [Blastocatellia bacterium]|jgi:hypothetical protein|nr:hypothetical protein [Blastocatellia bacterium]
MNTLIRASAIGTYILIMAVCGLAEGWRGIIPLHSRRDDVERVLGPSTSGNIHKLKDMVVVVTYTDGPCEKCWPSGWNVPTGTVVSISIRPVHELTLSDVGFDLKTFEKTKNGEIEGVEFYTNENEGITITYRVFEQAIETISYGPAKRDYKLACPASRRDLHDIKEEGSQPRLFDHYSDIEFSKERTLLEYFASRLREDESGSRGWIVVYAGRRARSCEAELRANRAKRYLVSKRGLESDNIGVINGGFREKLTIELYVGQKTEPPPFLTPTVRPSKIRVIPDDKTIAELRRSLRLPKNQCEPCK